MPPFFSVIILTYNRRELLTRAIQSLRAQTFTDWEAIIIDDGSTDGTTDALRPLLESDPRFRYQYQKNQGPGLARNAGIALSRGTFITFLDSDDEYLPHHLEHRHGLLQQDPSLQFIFGGVEIIGDPYVADRREPERRIHINDCYPGGTFFIKRELAESVGGFSDMLYGDDTEFAVRVLASGARALKCSEPTYRYFRTVPDSLCRIASESGMEGIKRYRKLTDHG